MTSLATLDTLSPGFSATSAPVADLPRDLLHAIVAKFLATPELVAAFPGGIHRDESGETGAFRDVLILMVIASRSRKNQGRGYFDEIDLRFTAYSDDGDRAEELGDLVLDRFDDCSLRFRRGYLMSFQATGGGSPPVQARGRGNLKLWARMLTFRAKVGRNPR